MIIVSGHQPVYLPWLGLLHKAALADRFVFMDDVQYLRQDWNNRNKIRTPDGWHWLTAPVALKASASDRIKDIRLSHEGWGSKGHWQADHFSSFHRNYARAPYWGDHGPWLESFYLSQCWESLADMNRRMLDYLLQAFGIATEIVVASDMGFTGRKSDLVLDHASRLGAGAVVTGALGRDYIVVNDFRRLGVHVWFQQYEHPVYAQRWPGFEPFMCAFDLLLNHGPHSREILMRGNAQRADVVAAAEKALADDGMRAAEETNQP